MVVINIIYPFPMILSRLLLEKVSLKGMIKVIKVLSDLICIHCYAVQRSFGYFL